MKNFSSPGADASARRAEAHRQAGLHAQRAQRWEAAVHEFERATDLAPADSLMWMNLARARTRNGEYATALEAALRACEVDAASPVACRIAAELALQMARPAD